jgi:hypothetical protein
MTKLTPDQYQQEIFKLLPKQDKIEKQIRSELLKNITKSLSPYIKIKDLSKLGEDSEIFDLFFLDKISITIGRHSELEDVYNYPVNVNGLDQNLYKEWLRLDKEIETLIKKRDKSKA